MGRHEKAIRLATHVLDMVETPAAPESNARSAGETEATAEPADEQVEDAPTPDSADAIDAPINELSALTVLARAHFDMGHLEGSEQFARRAVATAQQHLPAAGMSLARNLHRLALILGQRGDAEGSRAFFHESITAYESLNDRSELPEVLRDRDRLQGGAPRSD
jgi:hypothetical protein